MAPYTDAVEEVLNASFDAGVRIHSDGKILFMNDDARDLLGYDTVLLKEQKDQLPSVDTHVSFWGSGTAADVSNDGVSDDTSSRKSKTNTWQEVQIKSRSSKESFWYITIKSVVEDDERKPSFPGVAKLRLLKDSTFVAFLRHADVHQACSETITVMSNDDTAPISHRFVRRHGGSGNVSSDDSGLAEGQARQEQLEPRIQSTRTTPLRNVGEERLGSRTTKRYYGDVNMEASTLTAMTVQQQENIMTAVVESCFDPLFQIDEHGTIQMVNLAATKLFGYSRGEFLGSNISMICGGVHAARHDEYLQRYLATGDTRVIGKNRELTARRKDGTEFPINLGVAEVDTFVGETRLFTGYVHDLTGRKQREEAIQVRGRLLDGILNASLDPLFQIDQNGIIQTCNSAATKVFGWTRHEFLRNNISMLVGSEHAKNHDQYIRNYMETGIAKIIGKRRQLMARNKSGEAIAIELSVLEIETEKGDDRRFCGFVRDMRLQRQQEEAIQTASVSLQEQDNVMTAIVESSFDPLFQIDEKGIIQMVNHAATKVFGYTREELVGRNISVICGGSHGARHDMYLQRYLTTGETRVIGKNRELVARRKDGSEFPISLGVAEVDTFDGEKRLFTGYVHDLTERKQREEAIRERERLLEGIFDASLDPLFQIDQNGIIQTCNAAATKLFGWTHVEFLGSNISMLVGIEYAKNHDSYIRNYMETGVAKIIGKRRQLKARKKSGETIAIELSVLEIETNKGETRRFCGFIRDLTLQRQQEDEIRRSGAFTSKILDGMVNALLVIDAKGKITRVNVAATYVFRRRRDVLMQAGLAMLLHIDDFTWYKERIDAFLQKNIALPQVHREALCARGDGTEFPADISIAAVDGPDGDYLFSLFCHDLSDKKRMMEIEVEKSAAEALLMNVLPRQIAMRLKKDPSHIAESHECATILFADIVGFTSMSSNMEPQEVVTMLNRLFSLFDDVVEEYKLNKIKTIGDCYMVTSVPSATGDNKRDCEQVLHFALDMVDAIHDFNDEKREQHLSLRIGISCGPVVAGVVGTKRFLYDLWGDSVNTASRMESHGIPGRVQVTKEVVELVGDKFDFERRGVIAVKGKGEMETYFLEGRRHRSKPFKAPPLRNFKLKSESMLHFGNEKLTLFDSIANLEETIARSNATPAKRVSRRSSIG